MPIKVGIPRALLYYQYYPMWKTFLETLGAEVILSPPTTKSTLAEGASRLVAETCLPVKVFCGHAVALAHSCDYLFIPSIRSVRRRVYSCSKFLGLPDMVKAAVSESPPILDPEVDVNKGQRGLYLAIYHLARHFAWNPLLARKAFLRALQVHREYRRQMFRQGVGPLQAMASMCGEAPKEPESRDYRVKVAVIGHPYLVYDEFINHRLISRLKGLGAQVYTPEMVSPQELDVAVARAQGAAYWTYEEEVVGAAAHYLDGEVDGVIGVAAFGCGPDSLMMDIVEHRVRQSRSRPFMCLTIDEHAGETGLVTRLEAFMDMLVRRKRARP